MRGGVDWASELGGSRWYRRSLRRGVTSSLRICLLGDPVALSWGDQHAAGSGHLNLRNLCPAGEFVDRVRFRALNMNDLPVELDSLFNFTWSSVDGPPYESDHHLRLQLEPYTCTSLALVIRKAMKPTAKQSRCLKLRRPRKIN